MTDTPSYETAIAAELTTLRTAIAELAQFVGAQVTMPPPMEGTYSMNAVSQGLVAVTHAAIRAAVDAAVQVFNGLVIQSGSSVLYVNNHLTPPATVRTVKRDNDGRITAVIESPAGEAA